VLLISRMPIFYNYRNDHGVEVSIWKLEEELDYFRSAMYLYEEEKEEIKGLSTRKLLEWYASRYLLHKLSGWDYRGACLKDGYGKPYLLGSKHYISLSHSNNWIAAAEGLPAVGVDIQLIVTKITRIAPKFAGEEELEFVEGDDNILGLHFIWGAKESIYKAYGKGNIDLRKNIRVAPFDITSQIRTTAVLTLENIRMTFDIQAQKLENYVLVLATDITD